MGTAPLREPCECGEDSPRDFSTAAIQFTYGKEDWHGPTLSERLAQQKIDSPTAEPVGQRWV